MMLMYMYLQKWISINLGGKKYYLGLLEVTYEKSKMSRILNTGSNNDELILDKNS